MNEVKNRAKNVAYAIYSLLILPVSILLLPITMLPLAQCHAKDNKASFFGFLLVYVISLMVIIPLTPIVALFFIPVAFLMSAKKLKDITKIKDSDIKIGIKGLLIGLSLAVITGLMITFPPFGLASIIGTGGAIAQAMGLANLGAVAFPMLIGTLILAVVSNLTFILANAVNWKKAVSTNSCADNVEAATDHHSVSEASQPQLTPNQPDNAHQNISNRAYTDDYQSQAKLTAETLQAAEGAPAQATERPRPRSQPRVEQNFSENFRKSQNIISAKRYQALASQPLADDVPVREMPRMCSISLSLAEMD